MLVKGLAPHYPTRTHLRAPRPADAASKRFLQLSPDSPTPYVEPLSIGAGRRALAILLAVLIPAVLLFMLLAFNLTTRPDVKEETISVVNLEASEISQEAPEPSNAQPERTAEPPTSPQPAPDEPQPAPPPPRTPEPKTAPTLPTPSAAPAPPQSVVRPSGGAVYGPPDTRRSSSSSGDSERVGTAPNGEPLYAARWYREPRDDELRGYLSTASGPGWGLIACRTAPDYRVEDCVGLDEYPNGSQITRAVLAAAWAFQVRPPRRGGQPLVGAWVRIRIDYGVKRR
ncbi:hypothetical protein [Sphingopyxis sp. RIFCSPHIGHO2_12_FULL_65_19]|uniref:hypothetical protein n=1 Tax=Sphingopyxis sp. RIFCSPHIGHO2_12_FULL_65_19 TaxID=1802172 RepID=UPI000A7CE1C7|nr:hypothetical protein [Sphingopyxis sp. RIFCSPHIGHO2_12_FULL_65_19]